MVFAEALLTYAQPNLDPLVFVKNQIFFLQTLDMVFEEALLIYAQHKLDNNPLNFP